MLAVGQSSLTRLEWGGDWQYHKCFSKLCSMNGTHLLSFLKSVIFKFNIFLKKKSSLFLLKLGLYKTTENIYTGLKYFFLPWGNCSALHFICLYTTAQQPLHHRWKYGFENPRTLNTPQYITITETSVPSNFDLSQSENPEHSIAHNTSHFSWRHVQRRYLRDAFSNVLVSISCHWKIWRIYIRHFPMLLCSKMYSWHKLMFNLSSKTWERAAPVIWKVTSLNLMTREIRWSFWCRMPFRVVLTQSYTTK